MGAGEVEAFLSHLANEGNVAAATHQQALSALLFLYKEVLGVALPWLDEIGRPKKPQRLPTVLSAGEVQRLLAHLDGTHGSMARLICGTGMCLMECVRLRVKDIDFERREIIVRQGKGDKDRVTMLPVALAAELRAHLTRAKTLWSQDRAAKRAGVHLPEALARKYPNGGTEWSWFWVFPTRDVSLDPRTGVHRRHHAHEQAFQRAVKRAVAAAGLAKPASTTYGVSLVRGRSPYTLLGLPYLKRFDKWLK